MQYEIAYDANNCVDCELTHMRVLFLAVILYLKFDTLCMETERMSTIFDVSRLNKKK